MLYVYGAEPSHRKKDWRKMAENERKRHIVNEGKEKIMDDGERDGWRLVK